MNSCSDMDLKCSIDMKGYAAPMPGRMTTTKFPILLTHTVLRNKRGNRITRRKIMPLKLLLGMLFAGCLLYECLDTV